jgi:molybdopterin-containing oxidoreductase family membrane subunit
MWLFVILAVAALIFLAIPKFRSDDKFLVIGCACVFFSMWLEKGVGLTLAGFVPNPFNRVVGYVPTIPEVMIALGVYATGAFILAVLYKIAVSVKEEVGA